MVTACRLDWHGVKHLPVAYTNELGSTYEVPACDRWNTSYPYADADGSKIVYYGLIEGHGKPIRDYPWCRYCAAAMAPAAYAMGFVEVASVHEFGDDGQVSVRLVGSDGFVVLSWQDIVIEALPDPRRRDFKE